jgi:hypothetical protein
MTVRNSQATLVAKVTLVFIITWLPCLPGESPHDNSQFGCTVMRESSVMSSYGQLGDRYLAHAKAIDPREL